MTWRANTPLQALAVLGIGFWSPTLPGWPQARAALRGAGQPLAEPLKRPAPALLPPNERRRAPDTVAMALEVASQAVAQSGLDAATLPSVFASANGDLAITDALCATLATTPELLSPTRFHHSVHNAAAGYWTIATGCRAASSAVSAYGHSTAAGLLEAATLALADATPVLLACYDMEASGPLASVTRSRGRLALALVLAPAAAAAGGQRRLHLSLAPGLAALPAPRSPVAQALADNALADALPLCEALAQDAPSTLTLPLGPALGLQVAVD